MHARDEQGWQEALRIDAAATASAIARSMQQIVRGRLRRRGVVVGLSGGVDSSVVAALAALAVGPRRVLGVLMPERRSAIQSHALALRVADLLGIDHVVEDVTEPLASLGAYLRQAEAIRGAFPDYGDGWSYKLVLPSVVGGARLGVFRLVVESPEGERSEARLSATAYAQLVAATNLKQRIRKVVEYYHAERCGYAVAGTPNRLEYDQGFFVKYGDGAADVKPIAHLYKTQVHALAEHLGLPEEVRSRAPTTDTFPLPRTQEEVYFALPPGQMDLCLLGHNVGVPAGEVARATGLTAQQVERIFTDIDSKRRATHYLHTPPILTAPVPEVQPQSYGVRSRDWRFVEPT